MGVHRISSKGLIVIILYLFWAFLLMAACVNVQSGADGRKDTIINVEMRLEGVYVERKEGRKTESNQQTE